MVYIDRFTCWKDVQKAYGMTWPEPEEVYFAYYGGCKHQSTALVIFRRGEIYYVNEDLLQRSETLKGCWAPILHTLPDFLESLEHNVLFFEEEEEAIEVDILKAVLHKFGLGGKNALSEDDDDCV